jgi:multiple sugar transport system ATP-binding protein
VAKVVLDRITKKFRDRQRGEVLAVNEASFEVQDGEFVVLVGPSGCGKTTSLRIIAGLERQTSGDVVIGDRVVNLTHPKDRDIAMVFQDYALYPHMTVYDNLAFGLHNLHYPKKEIGRRVREAAELLQIGPLLERRPRELSGGQRQRVAVGRAIVRSPQVFLFDEPLSNLDAKLRVQMRIELAELHRRLGNTVVYVTHDQVEAMTLGDRIVVMNHGVIQQIDTPRRVYEHPNNMFVAAFIGVPPMNLIDGTIEGGTFASDGFRLRVPGSLLARRPAIAGRPVTLGIRAEDIHPAVLPAPSATREADAVGVVRGIEYLGSEVLVYLDAGTTVLTTRVGPQTSVAAGDNLPLQVDFDRVAFFDPTTQQRID